MRLLLVLSLVSRATAFSAMPRVGNTMSRVGNAMSPRIAAVPEMALAPGANVVVVGSGPVQLLAARLAALQGYSVTVTVQSDALEQNKRMIFDDAHPEDSLPITWLTIGGEGADSDTVDKAAAEAEGVVVALDSESAVPESALRVFVKPGGKLSHVSMMSRYLNGKGMMFTVNAAKIAANAEIWAGDKGKIQGYLESEAALKAAASEAGAAWTVVRAGTLKGGASGDQKGGAGEASFLNPYFYSLGQQDVVNWRLLFDCDCLGVKLVKGDTLPGPGFGAALTATSMGDGDSHRGAVAAALVNSLGLAAAANGDFSIGAEKGREFPKEEAWEGMFARA